ncbi:MAG: hypothetical protein EBT07_04885 [Actinobacteria bacterium]|nr:hypothetical protein [Actinomycetota bacterium]
MAKAKTSSTAITVMKWVYWIVGLLLLTAACYVLYEPLDRQIASVLVFLGGVIILYFYYVKWFIVALATPAWPPYQTLCPDYLTPMSPGYDTAGGVLQAQSGASIRCVDFVGVSRNGMLKRVDPSNVQQALLSDSTSFKVDPTEDPQTLKSRLQTYGLTWVSLFGDM